ncbi:MAG TPA: transcriptional regulator [Clostridium sp.]|nr:transcriptional regulator [Clostridium sp.]
MDYQYNDILGFRLREARVARGYSLEDLAKKIGITRQSLSKYENSGMNIQYENLIKISNVLDFPISFFKKPKESSGIGNSPVFFRSLRQTTAKVKESLSQNVDFLEEIYSYFGKYINFPPVDIGEDINKNYKIGISDEYIEEIALNLREHWGLGNQPINNLVDLLQRKGFIISRIELSTHKVDAFSSISKKGIPFIILGNDKESAVRSRMDCAHELGHIVLHSHLTYDEFRKNYTMIEDEANRFASAFLLPAETFSEDIFTINLDSFIYLKQKWKVSIAAMIVRAHNLKIITDDQYSYLFKRISAKKWRVKEPLDDSFKVEEPELLKQAVNLLIDNNILDKEKMIYDLSLCKKDIENLCCLEQNYLGEDINKPILRIIK